MKQTYQVLPCLLIIFLFVMTAAAEEGTGFNFPQTDAGKRIELYFSAFNSNDENEMRKYMELNYTTASLQERSLDDRMARYRQLRNEIPSLEPVKILRQNEEEIKLIAVSAAEQWLEISFEFEKNTPNKITRLRINLLEEPPDLNAAASPLSEAGLPAEVENYLNDRVVKDEFSGVVFIARGDRPIFQKAYGLASKEYNVPNNTGTRFNLGSINKFFTRIAIEQLNGQGKLSFDDRIGKFLPDYPNRAAAEKVTINHLLDMASGIGDFFGLKYQQTPKNAIRTLTDYLPLFAGEPLLFEPGSNRQYSNGGYVVLGLIIENASGQNYYDYIQEHICTVAGMEQTGFFEADMPQENIASGYTWNWDNHDHKDESRRNNYYSRPARGSSAGGGYSTVEDLYKLVLALAADKLSAPDASRMVNNAGIGIAGGAPGINAALETNPQTGFIVIVLSNYDPPAAGAVARKINSCIERLK
jgi:CubicO group peptidase (beta-lactamase class C family)